MQVFGPTREIDGEMSDAAPMRALVALAWASLAFAGGVDAPEGRHRTPDASAARGRVTGAARLVELFDVLGSTHGGPSFITPKRLNEVRAEARRRFAQTLDLAGPRGASDRADADAAEDDAYLHAARYTVSQLEDPHATYMLPERAAEFDVRYHGRVTLGAHVRYRRVWADATAWWRGWRRSALVTAVEARSPAARAGLAEGDLVLEVNGRPRGAGGARRADGSVPLEGVDDEGRGAELTLSVRPRGQRDTVEVRMRCEPTPTPTVHARRLVLRTGARGVCGLLAWCKGASRAPAREAAADAPTAELMLLRVSHFGATTAAEVSREIARLRADGRGGSAPAAVVIDLRDNDGGLLNSALATARLFLPPGSHLLTLCKGGALLGEHEGPSHAEALPPDGRAGDAAPTRTHRVYRSR